MAEGVVGGAQHEFAQGAGMGVHQRERSVVADRADIAEVIGDALDLGHQRRAATPPACGAEMPAAISTARAKATW